MLKKLLSMLIVATILHPSLIAQNAAFPDAPSATQAKVKAELAKYSKEQKKVNLTLKGSGKVTGRVQQTGEDNFQFKDGKTGEVREIAYSEVTEVKRAGKSTTTKILIAAGIAVGVSLSITALECANGTIHCR